MLSGFFDILLRVIIVALLGLIILLFGTSIFLDREDAIAWEKFTTEHACKIIAKGPIGFKGREITGYQCDDGITYWR